LATSTAMLAVTMVLPVRVSRGRGSAPRRPWIDARIIARHLCGRELRRVGREVPLDHLHHEAAEPARIDRVELDGDVAEVPGTSVTRLRRPGRQVPVAYLFGGDSNALEVDLRSKRHLDQGLFDFLAGIDAGGVKVPEVIDPGRDVQALNEIGCAVKESRLA
jgi:hypothetical protein